MTYKMVDNTHHIYIQRPSHCALCKIKYNCLSEEKMISKNIQTVIVQLRVWFEFALDQGSCTQIF